MQGVVICPHCTGLFLVKEDQFAQAIPAPSLKHLNLTRYGFTPMQERIVRMILDGNTTEAMALKTCTNIRYIRKVLSEQIYNKVGCNASHGSLIVALVKGEGPMERRERSAGSGLRVTKRKRA